MEDTLEGMFEAFGDFFEGAHGEVAFFELAVDHPFMDDGVDHLIDFLGGDAFETSGGAFDGIGEAEDSAFASLGARSWVAEAFFANFGKVGFAEVHDFASGSGVFLLLEGALVEEGDLGSAVMLLDDVDDFLVESVMEGEIDAFFDVGEDNQGTHGGGEFVVGVAIVAHIFGEVIGFHEFSDIVKVGAGAAHCGVSADGFGGGFGEIGDEKTMVISAWSFDI